MGFLYLVLKSYTMMNTCLIFNNLHCRLLMNNSIKKTTEQWVDIITKSELPAITSTAKLLDSFSNDDVSSLPQLSKAILHDQALSSCVLKVVNNIGHIGHNKVTTVSRASVVLGIHSVKNICLTSKLIEGLLKNKNLGPQVFERLTRLMATSFYSGVLAKMMVPEYDENTQEEVYLAAMLYRIGETAFWSCGGEATEVLIEHVHLPKNEFDEQSKAIVGTTFIDLSRGLAKQWELGDLLEKSLDDPESRTVEMQIISLADKLGHYIDRPPQSIDDFNAVLEEIAKIKNISVRQLKNKLEQTRIDAIALLKDYGASILKDLIKPLPTIDDFQAQDVAEALEEISPERAQLNAVMELTKLTQTSKDFNDFLLLALDCIALNIRFERSVFFMQTSDKKQLQARISFDHFAVSDHYKEKLNIKQTENVFSYVIQSKKSLLMNDPKGLKWRNFISEDVAKVLNNGVMCLAPVKIKGSVIGIICGQHFKKMRKITDDEYQQFCFLIEHLNMCLSMLSRK